MGLRPDLAAIDVDQAMRFALYETHRFCIRLPVEASLLEEDGSHRRILDSHTLGTFVHEYTHFSHNVTTVAGWATFELFVQLLGIFSHSLDDQAQCCPERLSEADRDSATSSARALFMLEGERRLPPSFQGAASISLTDVTKRTEQNLDVSCEIRTAHWEAKFDDGSLASASTDVGSFLIEEGIAYLLESFVVSGIVHFHDLNQPPGDPPFFPYVAYQALCRSRAPDITPLASLKIGLLALNFNRPGEALLRTLAAYQRLRDQDTDDETACETLKRDIVPSLGVILKRIMDDSLCQLSPLFEGRGKLEDGVRQIYQWFSDGLAERERDIWFDLDWLAYGRLDADVLSKRLRVNTACDVIQERDGDGSILGRDALITFTASLDKERSEVLSGVRTFQAQVEFLLRHLKKSGEFAHTAQGANRPCPYFTVCMLPAREQDPEVCLARPWTHWNRDPTCWYGAAVAGTLGHVLHKLDETT